MSLWKIAWRSIQQRSLASALTAFSMALGVALVAAVLVIHSVIAQRFSYGASGFDLIVGPKGDPLTLVLNTVFHVPVSRPMGTIPWSYYEEFTHGRFVPAVETAIPVATGHGYRGYSAMATIPDYFERLTYGRSEKYRFAEGRNMKSENLYEAVVGATVARKTGMKVGSQFRPVGGSAGEGSGHVDEPFTVVGILAPTGTPNDRAIFVNLEGFFACPAHHQTTSVPRRMLEQKPESESSTIDEHKGDEHDHADGEHADHNDADHDHAGDADSHAHDHAVEDAAHDSHDHAAEGDPVHNAEPADSHDHAHEHEHPRELTAILVCTYRDRPHLSMELDQVINDETTAQAVQPVREIRQLLTNLVGNVQLLLLILAVLVVIVAGIGILVSIYNSMNDRRRDIAIMRALGASRAVVMTVILLESILLSLGGGAAGVLLARGLIAMLSPWISEYTNIVIRPWDFQPIELVLIPGLILLATLVGFLPAWSAYRTDVAKSLQASN
ncbi:MAG: FtsX-like permease family protein [Planctomycetota bacterium]